MFASQKRIFAGKPSVHSQPFCPCYSDDRGFRSLLSMQRFAGSKRHPRSIARKERRTI